MEHIPHTPAILVDETILDANIAAMAEFAASHNLQLRPHAKTHKMAAVAAKQLAAGSAGLSVATLAKPNISSMPGLLTFSSRTRCGLPAMTASS